MKSKKIKGIIGALLALSLAFGAGLTLSLSKNSSHPEIVLADSEEETPVSNDDENPTSSEETPGESEETPGSSEETPSGEESSEVPVSEDTADEEKEESSSSFPISKSDILTILKNAFKDAIKDLINHIKALLKF